MSLSSLAPQSKIAEPEPVVWNYCAHLNGVQFTWQEDQSWHCCYIRAENKSSTSANYSYEYYIYEGERLADQGKHYFSRLKKNLKNPIKVNKNFSGITRVVLKNLKVERY
ncbi:MAG: hypothetical protein EP332_03930 [Bacteroidetes bacterium]|nr:MAG: hypothetical protein EP332_03930 [Bacteroidota bacterium]